MIQSMRNLAQSWVVKTLLLLLVLSFSIWGIGDIFRGNPLQREVARIGKEAITVAVLDHDFSASLERARAQGAPELTRQQAVADGLLDSTLSHLIENAGFEQQVKRLGFDVSEREFLSAAMEADKRLVTPEGKFNREIIDRAAAQANMSERDFIEISRGYMARQQLVNVLHSPMPISKTMAENLYRARAQQRVFDLISVKADALKPPEADDAQLQTYYNANKELFLAPEFRAVTIASLSVDDVAKDIPVSDDDLKKEFDAKIASLARPEQRDVVQVMVGNQAVATSLSAIASASGNLSSAAKAMKLDPIVLGKVEQKGLLPGLTDKIFSMKENTVSEPVQIGSNWQVVQVTKVYPAVSSNFDEAKETLRTNIRHDRALDQMTTMLNSLDDQLAAGHPLDDIADGMKMRIVKIPLLDATGKMPDGKAPVELPGGEPVIKAAFSQNAGETSPVIDDKKGTYAVVATTNVVPATVPAFADITDKVRLGFAKAQRQKLAETAANDIATELKSGHAPSSFANLTGVTVTLTKPVAVTDDDEGDIPPALFPSLFKLKKDEVTVLPTDDGFAVARLDKLIDVDPQSAKEEVDRIMSQTQEEVPTEYLAQYVKYMRVLFPVEINQSVLDDVRSEGG